MVPRLLIYIGVFATLATSSDSKEKKEPKKDSKKSAYCQAYVYANKKYRPAPLKQCPAILVLEYRGSHGTFFKKDFETECSLKGSAFCWFDFSDIPSGHFYYGIKSAAPHLQGYGLIGSRVKKNSVTYVYKPL